mmetsp:Transcript_8424/g.18031  ORF Transcript_8424/g.18031 Transcript_8424/m.18031 type:complete len:90 (-) Transcript_8424:98-367(-)
MQATHSYLRTCSLLERAQVHSSSSLLSTIPIPSSRVCSSNGSAPPRSFHSTPRLAWSGSRRHLSSPNSSSSSSNSNIPWLWQCNAKPAV